LRYIASKPTPLAAKDLHVNNLGEPGFTLPLVVQRQYHYLGMQVVASLTAPKVGILILSNLPIS
jgi:hypothetical protein